jgi:hypothetical protein
MVAFFRVKLDTIDVTVMHDGSVATYVLRPGQHILVGSAGKIIGV